MIGDDTEHSGVYFSSLRRTQVTENPHTPCRDGTRPLPRLEVSTYFNGRDRDLAVRGMLRHGGTDAHLDLPGPTHCDRSHARHRAAHAPDRYPASRSREPLSWHRRSPRSTASTPEIMIVQSGAAPRMTRITRHDVGEPPSDRRGQIPTKFVGISEVFWPVDKANWVLV